MGGTQASGLFGNGTAATDTLDYQANGATQRQVSAQAMNQGRYLLAQDLGDARETMMGVVPTGKEHEPMLHDQSHQLGIDLTQDMPRLAAVPLIQQAVLFPQLEEQFDLPSWSVAVPALPRW